MQPRTRISAAIVGILGLANLFVVLASLAGVFHSSVGVEADDARPETGAAFLLPLERYEYGGWVLESRLSGWDGGAGLVLYENGAPLGPFSRSVQTVRATGRGAYAHAGAALLFSSSDNTDVRANGRVYTLAYPLFVRQTVAAGMTGFNAALLLVWGWRMGSDGRRALILAARSAASSLQHHRAFAPLVDGAMVATFVIAVVSINQTVLATSRMLPCLYPDSSGYLAGAAIRTVGYPLFLHALLAASGDLHSIVPIQLNLLLGSVLVMGWAVGSLFGNRLLTFVIVLSAFTALPVLLSAADVLSEALFTPIVCLHVAAACRFLLTKSRPAGLCVGLTIGLAIAVRPAGYSLLASLPVLLLLVRDHWRPVAWYVLGGLGIVLLGAMAVQYQRHGFVGTQAFGGLSLAGHVAPLITEDPDGAYPELAKRIARRLSPFVQDVRDPSPLLPHWRKTGELYNQLLWGEIVPEISAYLQEREPGLAAAERGIRMNDLSMAIAQSAIRRQPGWYARHVLAHYDGLWHTFARDSAAPEEYFPLCRRRTETLLQDSPDGYPPVRLESYRTGGRGGDPWQGNGRGGWIAGAWDAMPYFTPVGVAGAFVVTVLAVASLVRGCFHSPRVQALAYLAVVMHAGLVLIAAVQPGIDRYTVPLMPVLIVELAGGAVLAAGWAWGSLLARTLEERQPMDAPDARS